MATTPEQDAILAAKLGTFSPEEMATLSAASTQDLGNSIARLITGVRSQGMSQTITSLVTGSVSSWPNLEAAAVVADGATLYDALEGFTTALEAHNANSLVANAVRAAMAAKKHLGV